MARFLEKQGFKEQALVVSTDPDHRFDLALNLGQIDTAREIALEQDSEHKWKQLGEVALHQCRFDLAEEALGHAQDFSSQLLLYTAAGKATHLRSLARTTLEAGKNNIAFTCLLLLVG